MMCSSSLTRTLLLVLLLAARRAAGSLSFAHGGTRKLSSFGTICEKAEIWTDLTRDPTVAGVQNIPWGKIEAVALAQIQEYEHTMGLKKASLEQLRPRIAAAVEQEKLRPATIAEVEAVINGAIASFTGAEKARASGCGKPGMGKKRDRTIRGAYRKSVQQMEADAPAFFEGGVSLNGQVFLGQCKQLLGEGGWCPNLCQELKDKLSNHAPTPGVTKSSELLKEQDAVKKALMATTEKLSQCQEALKGLTAFKEDILARKDHKNKRYHEYQAAEEALGDAQDDLLDLEDLTTEKQSGLEEALKELDAANAEVAAAKTSLQTMQEGEADLKGKVTSTMGAVADLERKVSATRTADDVIEKLKDAVSATTLKMWLFFQEAALEPVQSNGLSIETKLSSYFVGDITQLRAAGQLNEAVDTLDNFCKVEALPAFKAVKDLDVSPLCAIGEAPTIKKSLYNTVQGRITETRGLIEDVQSWMSPYKGQDQITAEIAQKLVSQGEPKGLREIIGVYGEARFFQYLVGWVYGGKFLGLIAQLKDTGKALSESLEEVNQQLAGLKDKYADAMKVRGEAEERLKAAASAQGITESQRADLEREIAALSDQTAKAQQKYDHLEELLKKAKAEYEKAQQQLVEAHKEGTSFLQALEGGQTASDLRRAMELLEVKKRGAMLRQDLEFARVEYEALREQVASLKSS